VPEFVTVDVAFRVIVPEAVAVPVFVSAPPALTPNLALFSLPLKVIPVAPQA